MIEERTLQLQHCMYQYSRAIYRSIKDLIDPYADRETQLESRRAVLVACEHTMERLAHDPLYFAKPDRALFQDIRRHFPITSQAQDAWAVQKGVNAAVEFINEAAGMPQSHGHYAASLPSDDPGQVGTHMVTEPGDKGHSYNVNVDYQADSLRQLNYWANYLFGQNGLG